MVIAAQLISSYILEVVYKMDKENVFRHRGVRCSAIEKDKLQSSIRKWIHPEAIM